MSRGFEIVGFGMMSPDSEMLQGLSSSPGMVGGGSAEVGLSDLAEGPLRSSPWPETRPKLPGPEATERSEERPGSPVVPASLPDPISFGFMLYPFRFELTPLELGVCAGLCIL